MSQHNQCDGCQAGVPLDENGNHVMGKGEYRDLMACQKDRYTTSEIAQLRAQLAERDWKLASLETSQMVQDSTHASQLAERDRRIAACEQELNEYIEEAAALHRRRTAELEQQLAERDRRIERQFAEIATAHAALMGHHEREGALTAQLAEAQAACAAMREALIAVVDDSDIDWHAEREDCPQDDCCECTLPAKVNAALATDAGKALLAEREQECERLRAADVIASIVNKSMGDPRRCTAIVGTHTDSDCLFCACEAWRAAKAKGGE